MSLANYRNIKMGRVVAGESSSAFSLPEPELQIIPNPQITLESAANVVPYVYREPESIQFVAVGVAVMQGANRVAVAKSGTFAKRIARALNNHKINERGY